MHLGEKKPNDAQSAVLGVLVAQFVDMRKLFCSVSLREIHACDVCKTDQLGIQREDLSAFLEPEGMGIGHS